MWLTQPSWLDAVAVPVTWQHALHIRYQPPCTSSEACLCEAAGQVQPAVVPRHANTPTDLNACHVEQCVAGLAACPYCLSRFDAPQADRAGGVVTPTGKVLLHTQEALGK